MHRLFIDQNVRLEVAVSLRADGHAIIHASEAGLAERDDETILRWATESGLAVVTFDIDQVLWFSVSGHGFSRALEFLHFRARELESGAADRLSCGKVLPSRKVGV